MNENNMLPECLNELQRYEVSDAINILITSVTGWLSRADLFVPINKLQERLNEPDEKMRNLLEEGVNFSSRTAAISFAAGMFKKNLAERVRSSPKRIRVQNPKHDHLSTASLKKISLKIADATIQLPFEQGLAFLVELAKEWIMTCDEGTMRRDEVFTGGNSDERVKSQEDINEILLRWIVMAFPY